MGVVWFRVMVLLLEIWFISIYRRNYGFLKSIMFVVYERIVFFRVLFGFKFYYYRFMWGCGRGYDVNIFI